MIAHPAKVLGLILLGLAGVARADGGPSDAEVARAIARGVAFVKAQQGPNGAWSYSFNHNHALGITALAGLALLENGVDYADSAIAGAAEAVRTLAPRSDQTYDLALAILFLARAQAQTQGPNDDLIRRLAGRLAGGEQGGMWTYTVPLDRDEAATGSARTGRGMPRKSRRSIVCDNSNTQFALLGIWAAGRHGFDANEALEAIDGHFRDSQNRDGRWGYRIGQGGTDAMTCAGLMGLAISAARPKAAERQTARARGAALAADPAFAKALGAVARDARQINPQSDIYYLWSLERVCVALGLRDLDGLDWYAAGARDLLGIQRDDGSWPDQRWGSLPNTCLALLFLRKANLAFELDRVLKLPGAPKPATQAVAPADAAPESPKDQTKSDGPADDEARVVVTGASDARFPEIGVEFEVKKPDGTFLLDARREDIHVFEHGQEMPIASFQAPTATEALPITVVLVVDRSLSMEEEDRIGALKRAVASFVQNLPQGSRVAVVAFGSEVEKICPFTSDPRRVREAVDRLVPAGATRYYDAVAEALELIGRETGRRAVLALTDGEDTFSQAATLDTVVVAARRLGLPVHTLGLGSEDEIESDALKRLAAGTRGQYYPARQADQLRTIYEQLARRLKSTYSLSYRTDRKLPDGTLRPVRVSYRQGRQAGETAVFIPGMVVPAPNWSPLFVALVAALSVLAWLPHALARRGAGP
jgi:VWFA-related protein